MWLILFCVCMCTRMGDGLLAGLSPLWEWDSTVAHVLLFPCLPRVSLVPVEVKWYNKFIINLMFPFLPNPIVNPLPSPPPLLPPPSIGHPGAP